MRRLEKRKGVVDDDWSVLQHCLAANQVSRKSFVTSTSLVTGLFSQATGDLFLQLENLDVTLSLSFLEATRSFLGPESGEEPLNQHHIFLLGPDGLLELTRLYGQVAARTGTAAPILSGSLAALTAAAADLQRTTFDIMFHPIAAQLEHLPDLEVWTSRAAGQGSIEADMPDFSFSPQVATLYNERRNLHFIQYISRVPNWVLVTASSEFPYFMDIWFCPFSRHKKYDADKVEI